MTTLEGNVQGNNSSTTTKSGGGSCNNNNNMKDTAGRRNNEDSIIFESMNEELANSLAERIKDAIQHGVQALPLLNDEEKCTFLRETIEGKYMKSVDVIEAYGDRNIFTIRQHPTDRRKQIIGAFQNDNNNKENYDGGSGDGGGGGGGINGNFNTAENNSSENTSSSSLSTNSSKQKSIQADEGKEELPSSTTAALPYQYPSKEDIPSVEDMGSLKDELCRLKEELNTLQGRQQQLRVDKASIESAQRVSLQSVDTIQKIDEKNVHETVTTAVMGGQEIQELKQQGGQVIANLDDSKKKTRRQRDVVNDDDDDDNHDDDVRGGEDSVLDMSLPSTRESKKKKRRSLEDEYNDDRKVVLSTVGGLDALMDQLRGK